MSIRKKLYLIIAVPLIISVLFLFLAKLGMDTMSGLRAYVGGEGLWAKAQKDAVYSLRRYVSTHDEKHYQEFLKFIKVPLGDKKARLELEKAEPDLEIACQGFIEGRNHPKDVNNMAVLFRRFRHFEYIDKAISIWAEADTYIDKLEKLGDELHRIISSGSFSQEKANQVLSELNVTNEKLTVLEDNFSYTLGEASRWTKGLLIQLIIGVMIAMMIVGFLLANFISGKISKGISKLSRVMAKISGGDLTQQEIRIESKDEIGKLALSFNAMNSALKKSYEEKDFARSRAENIIQSQMDMVLVFDNQGIINKVNTAGLNTLGYKEDELMGESITKIFSKEGLEQTMVGPMKALKGELITNFEIMLFTKDGQKIPATFNGGPIKDIQGNITGAIGVGRDMRETKRLIDELEQAKSNLEKKVAERTQELQVKIKELEVFNDLAVGRELKMVELKKEIERLKEKLEGKG